MEFAQRFAVKKLKTKYNATYLEQVFDEWEQRIEDMYTLHYPRMFIDPYTLQLSYESNHIEDLALSIIEERDKLHKFKYHSMNDLRQFYKLLSQYSDHEQRQIKRFQRGSILIDDELLNRISDDILQLVNSIKGRKRQSTQEEIKLEKEKRKMDGKARKQLIKERLKREKQQKQMQLV
ncbi:hypothetical protein [Staphylococcus warneri]|uniref:Uncharacterized protein n=1 Tax=Staphylococcus warneri TaxID=1292 RepID=A0A2T4Q147_STAWA|nr:hypothetical protein [Staphylococcus warneri]PTI22490.1 hypothetical protein BU080_11770 [Staphylococcus warneri]PTI51387.1 hypothetical protein BU085_05190 [Staphylococcus warneri]RIN12733.1 hypothetical protein BU086_06995 [Staphylococcus warneri]